VRKLIFLQKDNVYVIGKDFVMKFFSKRTINEKLIFLLKKKRHQFCNKICTENGYHQLWYGEKLENIQHTTALIQMFKLFKVKKAANGI